MIRVKRGLVVAGVVRFGMCGARHCRRAAPALRIGTFNIERFGDPEKKTDLRRLVELLDGLDADVIAVQEIEDPAALARLAGRLGAGRRTYAPALSRCGGTSEMRVGFLYDRARVELRGVREYPELDPNAEGSCTRGERPGLAGEFSWQGTRFDLLVVHLAARGEEEFALKRRSQWRRAFAIAAAHHARGAAVAILGDTNSTGFLDDRFGERTFIEEEVQRAGMRLFTSGLGCSEYFPRDGVLVPSLLDHVVATPDFPASPSAEVHGYCAHSDCRPLTEEPKPRDHVNVSDHCPVTVGAR